MTEYFNNSKEKQVRKVLTKFLMHPIVLTIIFGLAIIFVLPFNFKKIIFEPIDSNKLLKGTQIIMNDLDNDGNTEQIIISFNSSIDMLPGTQVQDLSGANYGQWNMKGNWLDIHNPIFGDSDNRIEIFGNVSALGNYTEYVPYKDSSCYLMVFDEDLKLKFEPIEFVGYPGNIIPYSFHQNGEIYLLCLYLKWNVKTGKKFKLLLFSIRGDFLSKLELPDDITVNGYSVLLFDMDGKIKYYLVNRKGQLFFKVMILRLII